MLSEQIEVNVIEVTLNELVETVLDGVDAKFTLEGGRLLIGK